MSEITVRRARSEEAEALSALCKRSKAHWGYDAEFMRLSAASLIIVPALIEQGRVLVAEGKEGNLLGMVSLDLLEDSAVDLVHMFVEPGQIGSGVGRKLFDAIAKLAKAEGATCLSILSDPNAAEFYVRMGAQRIGDAPSDAIPQRRLPLLRYDLV